MNAAGKADAGGPDAGVDLLAPVTGAVGPSPSGPGHYAVGGPAVAASYVAGTAALLRAYRPELSQEEVRRRLIATAEPASPAAAGTAKPDLAPADGGSGLAPAEGGPVLAPAEGGSGLAPAEGLPLATGAPGIADAYAALTAVSMPPPRPATAGRRRSCCPPRSLATRPAGSPASWPRLPRSLPRQPSR
ncbi:hypothetical protein ACFQ1L_35305 [Phytohabitans flavus]|uniref:hypothetical protein n=1 Tax=Phytohabitans flavus TaxID=1076124 RepID=UPI0036456274